MGNRASFHRHEFDVARRKNVEDLCRAPSLASAVVRGIFRMHMLSIRPKSRFKETRVGSFPRFTSLLIIVSGFVSSRYMLNFIPIFGTFLCSIGKSVV
jgi:hypothetical protein